MKTYSSVKEALRSGGIITPAKEEEEGGARTSNNYLRSRRHTVDSSPHYLSSSIIRLNPDNAPSETLDVSQYTQEDLKRLKEEDPFFYFSIPEIHLRSYRMGYPDGLLEEEEEEEGYHESEDDSEETSQDGDDIMELRSCKYEAQQGNVVTTKNTTNPSPQENPSSRSFSINATQQHHQQQQATKGRRATLPPRFDHPSLQVPIHMGPVTKSRRLSVEAHPDLVVETMLLLEGDDDDDDDISLSEVSDESDMEEDLVLRILGAKCGLLQE